MILPVFCFCSSEKSGVSSPLPMHLFGKIVPPVIAVIDHQLCHAAVNADVLAGNKTGFFRAQIQNHIRNILRSSDSACRLLKRIRTFIHPSGGIDSSRRNRVDTHPSRKTCRKRMCERRNTALRSGIAFRLRLAHSVPGGGDIDDRSPLSEIRREQFR